MNRRANLYLNIYSFIAFILSLSCLGLSVSLKELSYTFPTIIQTISFFIGSISGLLFIAIELFLFILMNNKSKVGYILYLLIDIAIAVLVNLLIPFSCFVIFILLKLTSDILKIKLVDSIYIPKEFDKYCKMFGIKIPDFKKKRLVKKTETKEKVEINVEKPAYEATDNSKRKSKNSTLKKAAI